MRRQSGRRSRRHHQAQADAAGMIAKPSRRLLRRLQRCDGGRAVGEGTPGAVALG
jgi:hypothetical protein